MWSICDRCSFQYRRKYMKTERSGVIVCQSCYDGAYDRLRHPQNRPPRRRPELVPIPDGRAQEVVD